MDNLTDYELDYIFDYTDFLLRRGQFDVVDAILHALTYRVDTMNLDEGLTYLTVTIAAKNKLRYRKSFYDAVYNKFKDDKRPTLFSGLD